MFSTRNFSWQQSYEKLVNAELELYKLAHWDFKENMHFNSICTKKYVLTLWFWISYRMSGAKLIIMKMRWENKKLADLNGCSLGAKLGPLIHVAKDHNPFLFQQHVPRSALTFAIHLLRHLAELTKLAEVCKTKFPIKTTSKRWSIGSPIDRRSKKHNTRKLTQQTRLLPTENDLDSIYLHNIVNPQRTCTICMFKQRVCHFARWIDILIKFALIKVTLITWVDENRKRRHHNVLFVRFWFLLKALRAIFLHFYWVSRPEKCIVCNFQLMYCTNIEFAWSWLNNPRSNLLQRKWQNHLSIPIHRCMNIRSCQESLKTENTDSSVSSD